LLEKIDRIQQFADRVLADNPMHFNFLNLSITQMTDETRQELLKYIGYCLGRDLSVDYLAQCYNTITLDTQIEQVYFRRHGKYRCSSFKEAAERVYFDSGYMKKYMYGLALTAFLWPNHATMHEFFVSSFPKGLRGNYLEIGPGHGYYFRKAADLGDFGLMLGVDISPTSVALSSDIMRHYNVQATAKAEFRQVDFLEFSPDDAAPFSCIVMGEVLEHVEDPGRFLNKIAQLSSSDSHIYITTCLNAPAIDHIFLFEHSEDVEQLARAAGLQIKERFAAPHAGKTLAECEAKRLAVNVAYVLQKQ
jgi:2-polyprenyl-3-methyl-5-hydroxy-6-metoxy-1,4-benzoquinol methylase